MAIYFHPSPGEVLMCNFDTGFKTPEMVKCRPVVVVSRKGNQLATVVPLSTVEPVPFEVWHCELATASMPTCFQAKRCWAKCDMVGTVAFFRLDRVKNGKCPKTGKRLYVTHKILDCDLEQIRKALRAHLSL